MKKLGFFIAAISFAIFPTIAYAGTEMNILLSDTEITVDGQEISESQSEAVYITYETETHGDVTPGLENVVNKVVNIAAAGAYQISGALYDGQIAVVAGSSDSVTLILDGVDITCRTAPVIYIKSAYETGQAGTGGVEIILADGSINNVSGSHMPAYEDGGGNKVKNDGAVSTNVSLVFSGNGTLNITADNEGIETQMHLTFNGGTYNISAMDDALNGSTDDVSHITINDGYIYASVTGGEEGDGIDSNGYLTINGGTVIALAHETSQDSGLDTDRGIVINGGTVIATGNMYEDISTDSAQHFMQLLFASRQPAGTLVTITDQSGAVLMAFKAPKTFTQLYFSSPALSDGVYSVYTGGEVTGTEQDGLYTNVTAFTGGTLMQYRGNSAFGGMGGGPGGFGREAPERIDPPEGFSPMEGRTPPEGMGGSAPGEILPKSDENSDGPEGNPPEMSEGGIGGGPGRNQNAEESAAEASTAFVLSSSIYVFSNISAAGESSAAAVPEQALEAQSFVDVSADSWYASAVGYVYSRGLFAGTSDTAFSPMAQVTRAMAVTVIYRAAGEPEVEAGDGSWYAKAVAWAKINGIAQGNTAILADPDAYITREEFSLLLYNYAAAQGVFTAYDTDLTRFSDYESISPWAEEALQFTVGAGLISGKGEGLLDPGGAATRAEIAVLIQNFMENIG